MTPTDAAKNICVIARSDTEKMISPILVALDDFQRSRISYCYWKSSRRVHQVLAGEGDVDLLIGREDQHRAETILLQQGFKHFPSVAYRDHPAISSFLGFDEASGRLVHFHLHFRLIIGERLLKNYRIPWEQELLARAIPHPTLPIRILDPSSEVILLAVRACLELRPVDPVTLRSWQATTRKFALDRKELAARVDRTTLRERAADLMGDELAEMVVNAIYSPQALEGQGHLRRSIRAHLAPYRTYNALEARLRSAGRAVLWTAGRLNRQLLHLPRPWSRRTPGGGCVIALTGVDGSGKTTVGAVIRAWLATEIDVVPIYFGTGGGRPSLLLWPLKLMVPVIRLALGTKPKGASHGKISNRAPGPMYSMFLAVWAMAVAWEKRNKLLAARRAADRGMVALTDRYPQNEIIGFNDGPLLARLTRVPRWLRRFEAAAYALAYRLPPDLVIKLVVTPETAARREPDMDRAVIRERIRDLPLLAFPGARVVCMDAEQPLEQVIRAVKREIWRLL
jgi:thymidylate kinase